MERWQNLLHKERTYLRFLRQDFFLPPVALLLCVESREIPSKKIHLKTYKKSSLLKTSTWQTFPRFGWNTPKRKGCPRASRAAKKLQQKLPTGRGKKRTTAKQNQPCKEERKKKASAKKEMMAYPLWQPLRSSNVAPSSTLPHTKDALRRSEFPRSAACVSSSPATNALQAFPKPSPDLIPNLMRKTSPPCTLFPNLVHT